MPPSAGEYEDIAGGAGDFVRPRELQAATLDDHQQFMAIVDMALSRGIGPRPEGDPENEHAGRLCNPGRKPGQDRPGPAGRLSAMQRPLRLLIAGCGGIAKSWLDHLKTRTDTALAGFVDLDPARAAQRAGEYAPGAATGGDLAAMIDSVRPDIVVDLTIPEAHADVACLALGRGCHVLAEKPMAASMADARRVLAAAQQAGHVHAVMQNRRYLPGIRRVRQAIESGVIGRLTELHADFFIGAHFGGFRDAMRHVLLLDMAIHSVDQGRFLGGLEPVAVNAVEWNPPGSWYAHGASALVAVTCAGGERFTYRGSWCAEGLPTSWECTWRVIGTDGTALWDGGDGLRIAAVEPGSTGFQRPVKEVVPPPSPALPLTGHAGCIDDMVTAIRAGRQPPTCGEDNIKSLAIIHAAIRSAESGGATVRLDAL
jgi:predicted dehydrogenase